MSVKLGYNCLKVIIIGAFLLFFHPSFSQRTAKEYGITSYKEVDETILARKKALGENLVAMIWKDTLKYKREIGDFSSRTVAPIASSSQWLTAALVMLFVDEGKISLDDKVVKYLPVFEKYGKNYITIRHCLTHFTGIQEEKGGALRILEKKKFLNLEEEVAAIAAREIQTNPGTEFRYSSYGFHIAGRILEVVSKKKFDMLAQQRLFRPIGMRQTTFSNLDGSSLDPATGAKSTADDFIKFLAMLLNKGNFKGVKVLSEASVQELLKIQATAANIKGAPKGMQGLSYTMGAWALDSNAKGEGSVLASPAFGGTWPLVDFNRGYACLFFLKETSGDQKGEAFLAIKDVIDTASK